MTESKNTKNIRIQTLTIVVMAMTIVAALAVMVVNHFVTPVPLNNLWVFGSFLIFDIMSFINTKLQGEKVNFLFILSVILLAALCVLAFFE